jgi:hypothetical protein
MLFLILLLLLTLSFSFISLYLLRRYSQKQPIEVDEGGHHLKHSATTVYLIGYPFLIVGLMIPIVGILLVSSPIQFLFAVLFSSILVLLGIYVILLFWNHEVYYNDEIIRIRNIWGKTKSIKWSEILKVQFEPDSSSMLYLHTEQHNKVGLSQGLKGFFEFRAALMKNTTIPLPPFIDKL